VNWADLMAAQGAFGTDFYDRSILRPKHRAYYRSGRPAIKIGPKGALGSHEISPIHSAPSLGQSIPQPKNNEITNLMLKRSEAKKLTFGKLYLVLLNFVRARRLGVLRP